MPMYGQSFTLADKTKNGLRAKTYGGGEAGEFTRARGFLAYYEVRILSLMFFWIKSLNVIFHRSVTRLKLRDGLLCVTQRAEWVHMLTRVINGLDLMMLIPSEIKPNTSRKWVSEVL